MATFVEMHVSTCGLPLTIQGIMEDGEVVEVKVIDDQGDPISWAMNERQIDGYKRMIRRRYVDNMCKTCG